MASRLSYNLPRTTKQGSIIQPNLGVIGGKQTIRLLHQIPITVRDRAAKRALRAAGKILRKAAVVHAPQPSARTREVKRSYGRGKRKKTVVQLEGGVLRKSLMATKSVLLRRNPYNKWPVVWVGPTWKKYGTPYNAWYAHFAEFGTKFYKKRPRGHQYMNKGFKFAYKRCVEEIKRHLTNEIKKHTK